MSAVVTYIRDFNKCEGSALKPTEECQTICSMSYDITRTDKATKFETTPSYPVGNCVCAGVSFPFTGNEYNATIEGVQVSMKFSDQILVTKMQLLGSECNSQYTKQKKAASSNSSKIKICYFLISLIVFL